MKKVFVYFDMPGVTANDYQNCWNQLRAKGIYEPKGLLHHTGVQKGNNLIVVDVWESEEAFQKFGKNTDAYPAKKQYGECSANRFACYL